MRRLKPFDYREPTRLSEAIGILAGAGPEAFALAGGTDLLVRMKRGDLKPALVVNLKRIDGIGRIERMADGLRIGALASIAEVAGSEPLCRRHPVLARAAALLGSASIRELATIGGNVGRASPAADTVPALLVQDARLQSEGPDGTREIALDEFFTGPGRTTLMPGELLTAILLPDPPAATGASYMRLGRRDGMDCALVGVAARLTLAGDGVGTARVALASCGPVPLRAGSAEALLLSGPVDDGRLREAARAAAADASPISDLRAGAAYRREMVEVLAFRALHEAWQTARKTA